jgi:hypothetical protein
LLAKSSTASMTPNMASKADHAPPPPPLLLLLPMVPLLLSRPRSDQNRRQSPCRSVTASPRICPLHTLPSTSNVLLLMHNFFFQFRRHSPTTEWQDAVSNRISSLAKARGQTISGNGTQESEQNGRPTLSIVTEKDQAATPEQNRRQRRRVDRRSPSPRSVSPPEVNSSSSPPFCKPSNHHVNGAGTAVVSQDPILPTLDKLESEEDEHSLVSEVGQLSLNEERELRFHGKASGLHLLGVKDRVDGRNEGGIWWVCLLIFEPTWQLIVHLFRNGIESGASPRRVSGPHCPTPNSPS